MILENSSLDNLLPNDLCFDGKTWFWIEKDFARALFPNDIGQQIKIEDVRRVIPESNVDKEFLTHLIHSAFHGRHNELEK